MNRMVKTIASLLTCSVIMGNVGISASARQIREFSNISASVGTERKVSSVPLTKSGSTDAVFNYSGGSASGDNSMVTATVRNSNKAYRGSCSAIRGIRKTFTTTATAGYEYDLYLTKTYSGSSILVTGSWSPDES